MQKEVKMESDGKSSKTKRRRTVSLTISGALAIIILLVLVGLTRTRTVLPTTMRPFDLNDNSINHPEKPYTISGAVNVAFCSVAVFFFTIMWFFCEGRLNNKSVVKKNILKVLLTVYFTILGACFMIILVNSMKNLAGHLRPYFLDACKPNKTMVEELKSLNTTWVDENMTETICTSERSMRYRWSFPSGHSAEAWYAMTLSILIIQYTKNITVKYTENLSLMLPFKAVFQFILFAFASWIGISRTLDYHHFWWDVLAGSLLGALIAVVMFYWFVKPVMESTEKGEKTCCSSCGEKCAPLTSLQKCAPLTSLQKSGCCYVETTESEKSQSQEEIPLGTIGGEEEHHIEIAEIQDEQETQGILEEQEFTEGTILLELQADEHPASDSMA